MMLVAEPERWELDAHASAAGSASASRPADRPASWYLASTAPETVTPSAARATPAQLALWDLATTERRAQAPLASKAPPSPPEPRAHAPSATKAPASAPEPEPWDLGATALEADTPAAFELAADLPELWCTRCHALTDASETCIERDGAWFCGERCARISAEHFEVAVLAVRHFGGLPGPTTLSVALQGVESTATLWTNAPRRYTAAQALSEPVFSPRELVALACLGETGRLRRDALATWARRKRENPSARVTGAAASDSATIAPENWWDGSATIPGHWMPHGWTIGRLISASGAEVVAVEIEAS